MEKLDKVRGILGTESIRETISAAFREVIRMAAVREELEPLMTRALVGICGVTELQRPGRRPSPAGIVRNIPLTTLGNGFIVRAISVRQTGLSPSHRADGRHPRPLFRPCPGAAPRPLTIEGVDAP